MGMIFLLVSAISEAIWNIFLAKSRGFTDWRTNCLGICFAVGATIFFKKALNTINLSTGIVIWSGFSILFSIGLDVFIFKTKIDFTIAFFMILCISSILGLHYYSKAH